jgi:peptidoglycan/LPS O-acetylase OafA/YrhL
MTVAETKQPPMMAPRAPVSPGSESPDRSNTARQLDYRPDIDGLRAIAVLAVIAFHAFPAWVRGGFVGVDVFFVISGYLIITILLSGMERDSFRFSQFYMRRIRRIFPALIVVLLACVVAGWLVLFSSEYKALGKHVAGSAAFVSNFVLWSEAGYFDKAAATKPLLHIWSLGIEEQLYIVWPLLLYLTWRFRTGTLAFLLLLLLGSFALNVHMANTDFAADYYSPLTRFWQLVAGAVLAYLSLYPPAQQWIRQRLSPNAISWLGVAGASHAAANNVKAICGLLLVVTSVLMIDGTRGYPGWWALLPVAGTYLMIAAGPNTWIGNRVLATEMLVAVGLISYPLYLWHWPLLSFIRIVNGTVPSAAAATPAILLSFVLAWLTYLLVEKPLRFGKSAPIKASILFVAMGMIGSAGYVIYANSGFEFRNTGAEDVVAAAHDYEISEGLTLGNPDADETILVGDSTMEQYIPRVRELIAQGMIDLKRNWVIFDVHGGCPPIPDIARDRNPACAPFVDKVLPTLDNDKVKTVALTAWWTPEFTDAEYYLRSDPAKVMLRDSEAAQDRALDGFAALISHLVGAGKRVFVLLETPSSNIYDPETLMPTGWRRLLARPTIPQSPTRSQMKNFVGKTSDKIQRVAEAAGARVIKPLDYLCDSEFCPIADKDGHLMSTITGTFGSPTFAIKRPTSIKYFFRMWVPQCRPTHRPRGSDNLSQSILAA